MRNAVLLVTCLAAACSSAQMQGDDDGIDARPTDGAALDAPSIDAPPTDATPIDAPSIDATPIDGPSIDATPIDGMPCPISAGHTIALDGTGDLAEYPASQRLTPGATTGAQDEVGITWDATYLYVTVVSEAFTDGSKPLHLYVEAKADLTDEVPSMGKEYSGLVAHVPFTPDYLIAARTTNDFGTGPYDGVYLPGGAQPWTTMSTPLVPGTDVFVSSDRRTLSVRTPWTALGGCPLELRLALHVVNGAIANEWKDLVPTTHTPWMASNNGYYDISLTGSPAISGWISL